MITDPFAGQRFRLVNRCDGQGDQVPRGRAYAHERITYDPKRRPRRGEMTFKERRRFGPLACAWLESIGATRHEHYDFAVETKCGTLGITPYDNCVFCRFDDVPRAAGITGQPIGPGKWNHHHFEAMIECGTRPTADDLLRHFRQRLEPILLVEVVNDP